jgi:hypothetical protein
MADRFGPLSEVPVFRPERELFCSLMAPILTILGLYRLEVTKKVFAAQMKAKPYSANHIPAIPGPPTQPELRWEEPRESRI